LRPDLRERPVEGMSDRLMSQQRRVRPRGGVAGGHLIIVQIKAPDADEEHCRLSEACCALTNPRHHVELLPRLVLLAALKD